MRCDAPLCPRGCGILDEHEAWWATSGHMWKCLACNAWWRHVDTKEGCGLIGTVPRDKAGKETLTPCSQPLQGSLFA